MRPVCILVRQVKEDDRHGVRMEILVESHGVSRPGGGRAGQRRLPYRRRGAAAGGAAAVGYAYSALHSCANTPSAAGRIGGR